MLVFHCGKLALTVRMRIRIHQQFSVFTVNRFTTNHNNAMFQINKCRDITKTKDYYDNDDYEDQSNWLILVISESIKPSVNHLLWRPYPGPPGIPERPMFTGSAFPGIYGRWNPSGNSRECWRFSKIVTFFWILIVPYYVKTCLFRITFRWTALNSEQLSYILSSWDCRMTRSIWTRGNKFKPVQHHCQYDLRKHNFILIALFPYGTVTSYRHHRQDTRTNVHGRH